MTVSKPIHYPAPIPPERKDMTPHDSSSNSAMLYIYSKLSNRILLTGYVIDPECQQFLDTNPDVSLEIPNIINIVNNQLQRDIRPSFKLMRKDDGSPDLLAINFNIENKAYDEILLMWDNVSKEVYRNIGQVTGRKIAIILDGE